MSSEWFQTQSECILALLWQNVCAQNKFLCKSHLRTFKYNQFEKKIPFSSLHTVVPSMKNGMLFPSDCILSLIRLIFIHLSTSLTTSTSPKSKLQTMSGCYVTRLKIISEQVATWKAAYLPSCLRYNDIFHHSLGFLFLNHQGVLKSSSLNVSLSISSVSHTYVWLFMLFNEPVFCRLLSTFC